ncbi:MAG: hypothetical protein WCE62_16830 [Polyangiales bacterium]
MTLRVGLDAALEQSTEVLPARLALVEVLEASARITLLDPVFVYDALESLDCTISIAQCIDEELRATVGDLQAGARVLFELDAPGIHVQEVSESLRSNVQISKRSDRE